MIKTDKVIYRTRTQEEYDWLMEKLEEAECMWAGGSFPTSPKQADNWERYSTETCIDCEKERITFADFDFYKNESDYKDHELIEVSDLMESEKKTITNEPIEQVDKPQKIKKIIYNIEVYFE